MNQRIVFFVALVCIAQLGVTVVRNFWSDETRRVQHQTLSQLSSSKRSNSAKNGTTLLADVDTSSSPRLANKEPQASNKRASTSTSIGEERAVSVSSKSPPPSREVPRISEKALVGSAALRDPFVPFFSIKKDDSPESAKNLQQYDVSELKLTAIIRDAQGNASASVEAPNGRDFIIRVGSAVGTHGGHVVEIAPTKVVVSEDATSFYAHNSAAVRELHLRATPPS